MSDIGVCLIVMGVCIVATLFFATVMLVGWPWKKRNQHQ